MTTTISSTTPVTAVLVKNEKEKPYRCRKCRITLFHTSDIVPSHSSSEQYLSYHKVSSTVQMPVHSLEDNDMKTSHLW